MHVIPQSWSHLHILVSVFPPLGLVFVLGFWIAGFRTNNDGIRRTCLVLLGMLGLLVVPIYFSGNGSMAVLSTNRQIPKELLNITKEAMSTHYGWAIAALLVLAMTGAAAWVELGRSYRAGRASGDPYHVVAVLATVALGLTAVASELGFQISHRELQSTTVIPDVSTSQLWSHV